MNYCYINLAEFFLKQRIGFRWLVVNVFQTRIFPQALTRSEPLGLTNYYQVKKIPTHSFNQFFCGTEMICMTTKNFVLYLFFGNSIFWRALFHCSHNLVQLNVSCLFRWSLYCALFVF